MKFTSKKYSELRIVLKPTYQRIVGMSSETVQGITVEFHDSVYETEDKEIIDLLRNSDYYGVSFFSNEAVADEPNPVGLKEENEKRLVAEEVGSVCPVCGFKAKSEFGLKSHMRSHQ